MVSQFSIDTSRFVHQRAKLHLLPESPEQRLRRSSWQQDLEYIKAVDRDIERFDSVERPVMKRLQTIEKVIYVAIAVFLLLLPLGVSYFPPWLPWGVGLPTLLILGVLGAKVKQKIEVKQRYYDALLLMREMLNQHSFKALHPLGEWDLPAVDRRLKSDLLMQKELKKKHPESADHVERLVASLDLDVTPMMKLHAARKLAQLPDNTSEWGQIKEKVIEAKEHLRNGDLEAYKKKMAEAKKFGLFIGGAPPDLDSLSPSAQTQVRGVFGNYQYFNQLYQELYRTYEEGQLFFGPDFCEKWNDYLEFAGKVSAEIKRLTPLFERADTPAKDWLAAARYVKEKELEVVIAILVERTRQLNREIQTQISNHPVMRIEAYKASFTDIDKKILQARTILDLGMWIDQNSEEAKRPIGEVMHDLPHAEEIKAWMETHEEWIVDPVAEIYERNFLMRYEYQEAKKQAASLWPQFDLEPLSMSVIQKKQDRLDDLEEEEKEQLRLEILDLQRKLDNAIRQAPPSEEVTAYNQSVMFSLRKLVGHGGEPSFWKRFWKALTRKLPTHPFDPVGVPEEKGFEKGRKIEEIVINDLLKKVDREMVLSNRIRRYGLEWAAITVLLIVEAIFWSNPWVAWGVSTSMLAIQGVSLYIDYRLRNSDKKKQGLKLQMLLRDHPLITRIPGSRPGLQDLRDTQGKYDLNGVTRTWARVLAEGDDVLQVPGSREEALAICRRVAGEGSEEARPPLERRLLYLRTLRAQGDHSHEVEIRKLQDLLYPPLANRKKPITKYINTVTNAWNRAIFYRKHVEERLDLIAQETVRLQEEVGRFDQACRNAEKIRRSLSAIDLDILRRDYKIASYLLENVQAACEGEHERAATENLEELLQEMNLIVSRIHDQGNSEELTRGLSSCFGRLSRFPVERLLPVIERLHVGCLEMEQEAQNYQRLNHRLSSLQKRFGSFDRSAVEGQLEELGRYLNEAKERLTKALAEERVKGALVALEKQLMQLDPKIEEKRQALIKNINEQGDGEIRTALRQNLASLNRLLEQAKTGLARQLVQAAAERNSALIDPALNQFQKEVREAYQQFIKRVEEEDQSPLRVALESQVALVKALFRQEIRLVKAFEERTLCGELKSLVNQSLNLQIPSEPTPVEMLEQGRWKRRITQESGKSIFT